MKLKTVLSVSLKSLLVIALFLSFQCPVNAQRSNTYGHGLHTYDQYKARVESNAYWNDPSRNNRTTYSTSPSSYSNSDYLSEAKEANRKRERESLEREKRLAISERTIYAKGKGSILLDHKPIPLGRIKDAAFVRHKDTWAIYNDKTSTLITDFGYDDIVELDNKHIMLVKGKQAGLTDMTGIIKIPMGKYRDFVSTGDLFVVKDLEGKFGATSFDGKLLRYPMYPSFTITHNFVLFKNMDGSFTLINRQGKVVADGEEIVVTAPNVAFNKFQSKYTFFNPNTGQPLMNKTYSDISNFWNHNILLAEHDGKTTVFNSKGEELSPTKFDNVVVVKEDSTIWLTLSGKKMGIIDILIHNNGFESLPALYDNIFSYDREAGEAEVLLNGEKKKVPIKLYSGYTSLSPFHLGYAKAMKGKSAFIINREGRVMGNTYDKIEGIFQHSSKAIYAIVEKGGKKGYQFLDYHRNTASQIQYEEVGEIDNNSSLSKVKMNGKWGVAYHDMDHYRQNKGNEINRSRNIVLCNYEDVDVSGNKTIFIKQNKKWGGLYYPYSAAAPQILIPANYDQITAAWYRLKQKDASGNTCKVVYYAKKGKSTDYYAEGLGKIKKDLYSKGNLYYEDAVAVNMPCKTNW